MHHTVFCSATLVWYISVCVCVCVCVCGTLVCVCVCVLEYTVGAIII